MQPRRSAPGTALYANPMPSRRVRACAVPVRLTRERSEPLDRVSNTTRGRSPSFDFTDLPLSCRWASEQRRLLDDTERQPCDERRQFPGNTRWSGLPHDLLDRPGALLIGLLLLTHVLA